MKRKVKGHWKKERYGNRLIYINPYTIPEKTDCAGLTKEEREKLIPDALKIADAILGTTAE